MNEAVGGVVRLSRAVENVLSESQLSVSQFRILDRLAHGTAASGSLADWLAVKPSSITTVVEGLVRRGLVQRGEDSQDRRRVTHTLTGPGRELHDAVSELVARRLHDIVGTLSDSTEARAMIESLARWNVPLDRRAEQMAARSAR